MLDIVSKGLGKSTDKSSSIEKSDYEGRMQRSMYDARGRRKYLAQVECEGFLQTALSARGKTSSFCAVLALTGARISEVLALTPERIDDVNRTISFKTLKQRTHGVNRVLPVSLKLLDHLNSVHHYRAAQSDPELANKRLWSWSRTTAWRRVKAVMIVAAIPRHISTARSVRHAFGAKAVMKDVNLAMIQKWLGHKDIQTTTIYATVVGPEERALAERMRVAGW